MAPHSSILAWKIPWTEEAWKATIHEVTKGWTRLYLDFISFSLFGGEDNPGSKLRANGRKYSVSLREKWQETLNDWIRYFSQGACVCVCFKLKYS